MTNSINDLFYRHIFISYQILQEGLLQMFDSATFTRDMLSNPNKLAQAIITAMEGTDTGTPFVINDPNNGFVMQMLANVEIFSKFSEKVDNVNSFFYPQRARNAEQLFPHLSEFDYVKLMASPATLPFVFAMSRDWIISTGVYFDENYNKIQIPATSSITMGGVVYSMYHPIDILINRNTGSVTAFYDTTTPNNLDVLSTNMLLDVQEYTKNGINWFQIQFNMYQFERQSKIFTVGSEQGFIKTLPYEDQFYAVEIYTQDTNGNWIELKYSLTQLYYDYQSPTAILSLLTDRNQLKIEIPQIYFDNRQISQSIKINLYTTKGSVNYSLSAADVTGLTADFVPTSSAFAAPLAQMPTWVIVPTTTEVIGGSDVMSYAQIREAVVNQQLDDRVAVTTPEIIQAGKKAGFDLMRVKDDLTERIYYASNILTDSNELIVPTFAGNILIADESLTGNPSTIIDYSDGYYTILPTTTFTISKNSLTCVPMTDGQVETMSHLSDSDLVDELNKGIYVRQPFHITLLTHPKSPQALIYNLLSPSMKSLTFIKENSNSAPQMSVISCTVNHLNNGTGGYEILLNITRSSNIRSVDPDTFSVVLACPTKTGAKVYLPATYISTNSNGVDLWKIQLATTYHITTDDFITVAMNNENDDLVFIEISINQKFDVLTSFIVSYEPTIPIDSGINNLLPPSLRSISTGMSRQTMILSLGQNLSNQIYCGVNTSWGNDVYKTADATVYYETGVPVYQTNETGVMNTRLNSSTNSIEIVEIYPIGSVPSETDDIILSTTANVLVPGSGTTTTLPLADTVGILVGMPTRGTNIPVNSVVTAVTPNSVTISNKITTPLPSGLALTFTNPHPLKRTTAVQSAAGVQLTVGSTSDLLEGQSVFGFDIPTGAKIDSIDSPTQFSLTVPTTAAVANNTLLTIINTTAPGVVKTRVGDIVTDPTGAAIVIKAAQNEYLIPAILFDGRLFSSEDPNDQQIVTTISQYLQNFANQISTVDVGLIEDSSVYYKPARTMGFANFGIGGGKSINMQLELSFSVTLYVDASVFNTQTLLTTLSNTVVSVINKAIQKPIISVSDITEDIKNSLGANVTAVEMGDISDIDGLRLISLEDTGSTPSIENLLSVQADGTITRQPNIRILYLPKPDTTEVSILTQL